jgi:hypothetical protein
MYEPREITRQHAGKPTPSVETPVETPTQDAIGSEHDTGKPQDATRIDATRTQYFIFCEHEPIEAKRHDGGKPTPLIATPTHNTKRNQEKPREATWHDAGKSTPA